MVDVNFKVPALEKLLDYAASGIGAVAGPMLASRTARKEAEARLIRARAEADSLKLIADARRSAKRSLLEPEGYVSEILEIGPDGGIRQRIDFQEKKRQANIGSVVQEAATGLGDKEVPDHEPDPDWTARFFDCVQDVSSENMRKLWAKVLSGEVERPGWASLRTLDILRNMTQHDADLFNKFCEFVIGTWIFYPDEYQESHPVLLYENIVQLESIGLVHYNSMLSQTLYFNKREYYMFQYQKSALKISKISDVVQIDIPAVLLTKCGRELYQIMKVNSQKNYLQFLSHFLKERGCVLSCAHILEMLSDGGVTHTVPFVPIEPKPEQIDGSVP